MVLFALCDDGGIEVFDSPEQPPSSMEWIDVENEEYHFCDEDGQLYRGQIVRPAGFFHAEKWCLVPVGQPSAQNISSLIDNAVYVEPNSLGFVDLESLKNYLIRRDS